MKRRTNRFKRIYRAGRRAATQILMLVTVGVMLVTVVQGTGVIKSVYEFVEVINMQQIRERLDTMDPYSYDYIRTLAEISDSNYYLLEVFDENKNIMYTNSMDFLYAETMSSGLSDLYRDGSVTRNKRWFDSAVTLEVYSNSKQDLNYLRYIVELANGDSLRIWLSETQLERNSAIAATLVTVFIIISCVFIVGVLVVYTKRFSRPVAEMSDITDSMSRLDFTKKCGNYRQSDVKNLGSNINTLSSSLSETLDELQDKNAKLSAELEHSALIDESRKNFIANVSHELKTPISIIQGYAEGLKLGVNSDPEGSEEYCDIILEESAKMHRMVMDLLNLEKLESGTYVPVLEELDFSDIVKKQLAAFALMFEGEGVTVHNLVPDGIKVHSDEKTVLLVLQNFLSNAVSNIGGKKVIQLTCADMGDDYRVSVYNSGETINESELDKIWYSFYKSQKKRKNEELHFGLGLPVVKAVQKRLSKDCGVINEHGGVRFWFDIGK